MREVAELFLEFLKIGGFTFGGGLVMVPLLQDTVRKRGWLEEEELLDCIAVAQSMPGVIAINMATYIGYRRKGVLGAIAATLGVILPAFISIIIAMEILGAIGENRYVTGAFTGIKAASCGLIFYAAYNIGRKVWKNAFTWILGIAGLVLVAFLDVSAIWVILGGAVLGLIYQAVNAKKAGEAK